MPDRAITYTITEPVATHIRDVAIRAGREGSPALLVVNYVIRIDGKPEARSVEVLFSDAPPGVQTAVAGLRTWALSRILAGDPTWTAATPQP